MLRYEATRYVHNRAIAVEQLLSSPEADGSIRFVVDLVAKLLKGAPKGVLAFEDIDGDRLGGPVYNRVVGREINPLVACFWLDKKLIKTPRPVIATQVLQEYVEPLPPRFNHLIILAATLDPESVAAMLYRITAQATPDKVTVAPLISSLQAVRRLRQILDAANLGKLHIEPAFHDESYGEDDFHEFSQTESPTIQQVHTPMVMPLIISEKLGFGPQSTYQM